MGLDGKPRMQREPARIGRAPTIALLLGLLCSGRYGLVSVNSFCPVRGPTAIR
jgi:hypothetical protein